MIIALNVVIIGYMARLSEPRLSAFVARYALIPLRLTNPHLAAILGLPPESYLEIAASLFLHGGWLHLSFNIWSMWAIGPEAERRFGHASYALLYGASGLAAALTYVVVSPLSLTPMTGASGAIAGVLAAMLAVSPRLEVELLAPGLLPGRSFRVTIVQFCVGWFIVEIVQGYHSFLSIGAVNHVPWWVHLGAFAAGGLYGFAVDRARTAL